MKIAKLKKIVEKASFKDLWNGISILNDELILFPDQTILSIKDIKTDNSKGIDINKIVFQNGYFLYIDWELYDWEWEKIIVKDIQTDVKESDFMDCELSFFHTWKWKPLYEQRYEFVSDFDPITKTAVVSILRDEFYSIINDEDYDGTDKCIEFLIDLNWNNVE